MDSSRYCLKKLIPDISLDELMLTTNTNIIDIINHYLAKKKIKDRYPRSLKKYVGYLKQLFPTVEQEYILELLTLFCDLPNKGEIVLRILVDKVSKSNENDLTALNLSKKRQSMSTVSSLNKVRKMGPNNLPDRGASNIPQCNTDSEVFDTRSQLNSNIVNERVDCSFDLFNNNNNEGMDQFQNSEHQQSTDTDIKCKFGNDNNESVALNPVTNLTSVDENYGVAYLNKTLNLNDKTTKILDSKNTTYNSIHTVPSIPKIHISKSNKPSTITSQSQGHYSDEHDSIKHTSIINIAPNNYHLNWQASSQQTSNLKRLTDLSNESLNTQSGMDLLGVFADDNLNPNKRDILKNIYQYNTPICQTQYDKTTENPLGDTFMPEEEFVKNELKPNNGLSLSFDIAKKNTDPESLSVLTENQSVTNPGCEVFDLIKHISTFTSAPLSVIRKVCRKEKVKDLFVKPEPYILNTLCAKALQTMQESELIEVNDSSGCDDDDDVVVTECINAERVPKTNENSSESVTIVESPETSVPIDDNLVVDMKLPPDNCDTKLKVDTQLFNTLCGIFTDACPKFIKKLCAATPFSDQEVDVLITSILSWNGEYPKRAVVVNVEPDVLPDNQLDILKEFLPDADPDFLTMQFDSFDGKPDKVKAFLNEAMEKRDYPKMKDYLRRQQLSAQQKQYLGDFDVENFVKILPDCQTLFENSKRVLKLEPSESHYAIVFLRNTFNKVHVRTIQNEFAKNKGNLFMTIKKLKTVKKHEYLKSIRKPIVMPQIIQNIPLLQEIAYYSHEEEIKTYLKLKKEEEISERKEAINKGTIKTCTCCYDEEVLPRDIFSCNLGCNFCKPCIIKATEVRFGEGKLDFPCLANCNSEFSLQTLQIVLTPKLFSKIAQKKTLEEIKTAGISELEFCPFCDFATIPAEGYSVFTCLNPDCMKESCRSCKEPSHIPLRCDEIEKDEDIKARTYVENKMTEALLRKCWKCGLKFFKEEGCNKMTCSCGAQMCYVCGEAVKNYQHFNGNGGDRTDLCPLYSDANAFNQQNVLQGAKSAKAELGDVKLKYDPTVDVKAHYKERARKNPQPGLLEAQNLQMRFAAVTPRPMQVRGVADPPPIFFERHREANGAILLRPIRNRPNQPGDDPDLELLRQGLER